MVSSAKMEGTAQILSAGVRKTIQQIKEIVGHHSDADIYVALKETNMDPNETAQKLLNQDPFHEVKRKKDKKKENAGFRPPTAAEPRRNSEHVSTVMRPSSHTERYARRTASNRSSLPDAGVSREFRIVRDNRINHNIIRESKPTQSSPSISEAEVPKVHAKSDSVGISMIDKVSFGRIVFQTSNGPSDSPSSPLRDGNLNSSARKDVSRETSEAVPAAALQMLAAKPPSTASSINSVVGVYSSSTDPVHVPSPDSRPAAKVGAIRREVGAVGAHRQNSESSSKLSSSHSNMISDSRLARDGTYSKESVRSSGTTAKSDQSGQNIMPESTMPSMSVSRSFSNNQYNGRSHQLMSHQKAPQPNKEWKPKSSQKVAVSNGTGVIGMPSKAASVDNTDVGTNVAQVKDQMSRVNISENQNVIIASHIRVSETDRCRLTFGSLGTDVETKNSVFQASGNSEELYGEPSGCLPVSPTPESSNDTANGKQLDLIDDHVRDSGSDSTASISVSEQRLMEKKEVQTPENLDNYADLRLVRANSPPYVSPEAQPQQDTAELQSFSSYDPQTGYDMPYFRPIVEEPVRGPGLASAQEALISHAPNSIPSSSMAMIQQQQQQQQQQAMAQMYPQLHVSHFANVLPYRQYLSPVYVPPMAMPGYSGNAAYPHPSNGSSYVLMPGSSSHLNASGLKYGIQQFKPLSTGSPTVFGNFTSPTGYAVNAPGVIGSGAGLEDSSRLKYKDGNLYVPTPQAETSEIWMNPRDLQSASYYNVPGQTPHAAYLPAHSGHASFNAAAAAAQSSHMQFPGLYHPPPQPTAIANAHHMGPAMGGNVGVGVAAVAPGAQVGSYQQPQMGHQNWTGNF